VSVRVGCLRAKGAPLFCAKFPAESVVGLVSALPVAVAVALGMRVKAVRVTLACQVPYATVVGIDSYEMVGVNSVEGWVWWLHWRGELR